MDCATLLFDYIYLFRGLTLYKEVHRQSLRQAKAQCCLVYHIYAGRMERLSAAWGEVEYAFE